uniref:Uncharacterized protein n=1 Tax=Moniliophthora roreri TaxID=221103 RepID=A0A0W0GCS7_MONRR
MSKNKQPIMWCPIHDACMQNIKDLCCEGNIPVLHLINPKLDESIWVICDASVSGVGAIPGEIHDLHKYVSADARLDEDGEDLPLGCKAELSHMPEQAYSLRRSSQLKEKQEKRDIEAAELEANKPDNHIHSDDSNKTEPPSHYFDPTVIDSLASGPDL